MVAIGVLDGYDGLEPRRCQGRPVARDSLVGTPLCYQDVTGVLPGYYHDMLWLNQEL
jgi:hypothetical protein